MYCGKCGTQVPDNTRFCPNCGEQLCGAPNDQGATPNGNPADREPNLNGRRSQGRNQTMAIVAYITWIGLIVAFIAGDTKDPFLKFHMNQSLVILLFSLLKYIPIIGYLWFLFMIVCWIIGLVSACNGTMKEVPVIGSIHILN